MFTSLRVQRAQNNATLPNSKNASSKDNNDNEAVRENSKEEEEEKSGNYGNYFCLFIANCCFISVVCVYFSIVAQNLS